MQVGRVFFMSKRVVKEWFVKAQTYRIFLKYPIRKGI